MMRIQESGEMYLETILIVGKKTGRVRAIDVAEEMSFSKPSVSRALGILRSGGFINVDKNGYITLTDVGKERAEKIYERHNVLTEFFIRIGVPGQTAQDDACKVEHHLSDETFEAIKRFTEQLTKK